MNKIQFLSLSVAMLASLSGCAQFAEETGISERTGMAAATGGAIGAGLGAIVGHQTGDFGTGLTIGAVAGAAAGTMVGEAFSAQDAALEQQDEILARQKEILSAQSKQIYQYKGSLQDKRPVETFNPEIQDSGRQPAVGAAPSGSLSDRLRERETAPPQVTTVKKDVAMSAECAEAFEHYGKGLESSESADRFFYLRKTLTLCPKEARFHAAMGEAYEQADRKEDAEFEYREALKLNPQMTGIKQRLDSLRNNTVSDMEAF